MTHFEKYVNCIRKYANYYSSHYNIEYDEVEAQGYLIYCECLESYDVTKGAKFITHLTIELKRLKDYCESLNKHGKYSSMSIDDEDSYDGFVSREFYTMYDILEASDGVISSVAQDVLKWILERSWEKKGRAKPTISNACEIFHMSPSKMKRIWNEIGNFYRIDPIFAN